MQTQSPSVASSQTGPHKNLNATVRRYLNSEYQRPPAEHTKQAFGRLLAAISARAEQFGDAAERALILDSGCGTGTSTLAIARQHPGEWVIGVDKSAKRLARGIDVRSELESTPNAFLLRADLIDFWRLAAAQGWALKKHYILYPNPWPKPEHLQRRWQAHPVFPSLLALGGELELRSNWRIYIDEFAQALQLAGWKTDSITSIAGSDVAISAHEAKYLASGHECWRLVASQ